MAYGRKNFREENAKEIQDLDKILKGIRPVPKKAVKKTPATKSVRKGMPLKAPKNVAVPTAVSKPRCKEHGTEMSFDPAMGFWRCEFKGCSVIARPKTEVSEATPIQARGRIEAVFVPGPNPNQPSGTQVVLKAENGVYMDISQFLQVVEQHPASHRGPAIIRATFDFSDFKIVPRT